MKEFWFHHMSSTGKPLTWAPPSDVYKLMYGACIFLSSGL